MMQSQQQPLNIPYEVTIVQPDEGCFVVRALVQTLYVTSSRVGCEIKIYSAIHVSIGEEDDEIEGKRLV